MKATVIVQARIGSARLPGKVLMRLGTKTVLEHVLERCKAIALEKEVCLATSDLTQDDPVAAMAKKCGVALFRGDERDVLSRYYGAAEKLGADDILRVTADCPLLDPEVCTSVINARRNTHSDYACNFSPPSFPHGLDCEAFSRDALRMAHEKSETAFQREHVTVWLIENPHVKKVNVENPGRNASRHRWTLDTPDDYAFLSRVFTEKADIVSTLHWQDVYCSLEAELVPQNGAHA